MHRSTAKHRVVVVGAGFGGLEAVKRLAGAPVAITVVDRRNHHLFQPLLYQVATASLATADIAWPIRSVLSARKDVTTLLGTVIGVNPAAQQVTLENGDKLPFDTLILATGAGHAYFGHDAWRDFAPGLKTLEDATDIRGRLLLAFERAEREPDPNVRSSLLTFVVVGAGPTGVELAGTIVELARDTLPKDFRHIDTVTARVVLVEAGARVLPGFARELSDYARRSLEGLGVEVSLGEAVSECTADGVVYGNHRLAAKTIIWAAGVKASPAAEWLGAPADKEGRIHVAPDLSVSGMINIFAIGDTIICKAPDGMPVPGIAPAAKQEGRYVADVIRARLLDLKAPPPFGYRHQGSLAQIGKGRAIADFGWIRLRGRLAWWIWGIAHVYFLIGTRTRLNVAINWLWFHFRNQRGARLITQGTAVLSQDGAEGEPHPTPRGTVLHDSRI